MRDRKILGTILFFTIIAADGWSALPARKIDENDSELYYEAMTNSFAHFRLEIIIPSGKDDKK